jgi:UDP-N-acetylglucosamine 2-epimerase (non-hydrolysing)
MKKILVVFGTRPEAIKMCPLVNVLLSKADFEVKVCVFKKTSDSVEGITGFFEITPEHIVSIEKDDESLLHLSITLLQKMESVLDKEMPDLVLVQGNSSTSFITALASFYMNVPVGHVEAGLRTYNLKVPYPEEFNRQSIDIISSYNFVPTRRAKLNLIKEGKNPANIFITGNTAIDTLKRTIQPNYTHPLLEWSKDARLVIVSIQHQKDIEKNVESIFKAVKRIVEEIPETKVLCSAHLNPKTLDLAERIIADLDGVRLIGPLPIYDFHNLMNHSIMVLTDSEGVQEEAPSLGKPVLVLRDNSDRPEGIQAGTLKMVGTDEDNIVRNCKWLLSDTVLYQKMSKGYNPYGDGYASERIADIIQTGRRWEWNEKSLTHLELTGNKHSKGYKPSKI